MSFYNRNSNNHNHNRNYNHNSNNYNNRNQYHHDNRYNGNHNSNNYHNDNRYNGNNNHNHYQNNNNHGRNQYNNHYQNNNHYGGNRNNHHHQNNSNNNGNQYNNHYQNDNHYNNRNENHYQNNNHNGNHYNNDNNYSNNQDSQPKMYHGIPMYEDKKKIANETLSIINKGEYSLDGSHPIKINNEINDCVKYTKIYSSNQEINIGIGQQKKSNFKVYVTTESTLEAAKTIIDKYNINDVAVLNFASATKPGGGWLNGRDAQEETITRQSALYLSISKKEAMDKFYKLHENMLRSNNSNPEKNFYTDTIIYSPKVPVIRDAIKEELIPNPFFVSFITSAATNFKSFIDDYKKSNKPQKKIFIPNITNSGKSSKLPNIYGDKKSGNSQQNNEASKSNINQIQVKPPASVNTNDAPNPRFHNQQPTQNNDSKNKDPRSSFYERHNPKPPSCKNDGSQFQRNTNNNNLATNPNSNAQMNINTPYNNINSGYNGYGNNPNGNPNYNPNLPNNSYNGYSNNPNGNPNLPNSSNNGYNNNPNGNPNYNSNLPSSGNNNHNNSNNANTNINSSYNDSNPSNSNFNSDSRDNSTGNDPFMSEAKRKNYEIMSRRCEQIIKVCIDNGNRAIVLGAFGCGIFGNDPAEVANIFYDIFYTKSLSNYLDCVVFAIKGASPTGYTFTTFQNKFSK